MPPDPIIVDIAADEEYVHLQTSKFPFWNFYPVLPNDFPRRAG